MRLPEAHEQSGRQPGCASQVEAAGVNRRGRPCPSARIPLTSRPRYGDDADPLGLTEKDAPILQSQRPAQRSGLAPRSAGSVLLAPFAPCVLRQPTAVWSGRGFKANSPVKFYLLPGTYIGELTTDDTGTYQGTLPNSVGATAPVAFPLPERGPNILN